MSELLRVQIQELKENLIIKICDKYYPYNLRLIYWKMEEIVKGKIGKHEKGFNEPNSLLNGINVYHVHHNQ